MKNKNFKLIAIRPLSNCNKDFRRILKENTTYLFNNEYDFSKYDRGIVEYAVKNKTPDIYSFKNKFGNEIMLNISAIVGENGTGKSSLVELLYVALYNLSTIKGILYDEDEERFLTAKDTVPEIKVEVFYEVDEVLHRLRLDNTNNYLDVLKNGVFEKKKTGIDLNDFFYTLAINYSLHSLNSRVLGNWLIKLFHKNDSYQTPIVLNPYREEGKIDINNEEYLIKSRLISNILGKIGSRVEPKDSLRNVLENKTAYRLWIKLDKNKFDQDENGEVTFKYTKSIGKLVLPIVFKHFFRNQNFVPNNTHLNKYAIEYILRKVNNIAEKYDPYKRLFRFFSEDQAQTEGFINMLSQDKSHVTFKLRQALNFLTNELYFTRKEQFDLTVSYLSRKLNEIKDARAKELIELLPPAFFDVDIEFDNNSTFSTLSSGEKQRIFCIATLIYHLNNLCSTEGKIVTNKYKRVNFIFDEIELYFHPELQRNLINDVVENLKKIDLKEIYAINLLLITHSPFILSDIPTNNILFLTIDGQPMLNRDNIRTFGGNIHELLAHSFFLKNGSIGEFSRNKIQEVINQLQPDQQITEKKNLPIGKSEQEFLYRKIHLIGEPFLKQKLLEMYYAKFDKEKRIKELENEIKRMRE